MLADTQVYSLVFFSNVPQLARKHVHFGKCNSFCNKMISAILFRCSLRIVSIKLYFKFENSIKAHAKEKSKTVPVEEFVAFR